MGEICVIGGSCHCGVSTVTALSTSDDDSSDVVFTSLSNSLISRRSSLRADRRQLHTTTIIST